MLNDRRLWLMTLGVLAAIVALCIRQTSNLREEPKGASSLHEERTAQAASKMDSTVRKEDNTSDLAAICRRGGFDELTDLLRREMEGGRISTILDIIAGERPEVAIELAQTIGRTEEERTELVMQLTQSWAARDSKSAWTWLIHQSSRLERLANGSLLNVILNQMAVDDPDAVLDKLNRCYASKSALEGIARSTLLEAGIGALVKSANADLARELVEQWLRDDSEGRIDAALLEMIARESNRIEAGAAWLQSLPASGDRNAAIANLAGEWVNRDAETAMNWAKDLPISDGKVQAMQRAFGNWLESDGTKAANWLNEHLSSFSGSESDELINNLVNNTPIIRADPEGALLWIERISDPAMRAQIREQMLLRWGRRDPGAVQNYLVRNTAIDPERKGVLLQALQTQQARPDSSGEWFAADTFEP